MQAAIVHDVCEVHSTEARDQLDIDDRAAYASVLKELQQTLDSSADPEVATQKFCEFGLGLPKPPGRAGEPHHAALALQLPFCFEVSALSGSLVSSAPERPCDDVCACEQR